MLGSIDSLRSPCGQIRFAHLSNRFRRLVRPRPPDHGEGETISASADIENHTQANSLLLHHAELDDNGRFAKKDEWITVDSDPGHDELCYLEQEYFLRSIQEDINLDEHMDAGESTLRIVLAADESTKTGQVVTLS